MNKILFFLSLSLFAFQLQAQRAKNISQIGYLSYTEELNDVWAYVDGNGHEYALVGVYDGVSIVDITSDPANPTELFFIPGEESIWRDLKTFQNYAYVTNETDDGVLIIDLSDLPNNISSRDTIMEQISTAHNVWIDENGIMYLVGVNNSNGTGNFNGGMAMFDLNQDPWRPVYLGAYTERYIHDVYVRGDTAYAGEIDDGLLTIIDVSTKSSPVVLGSRSYANSFTHNTWLNDAGTVCFTTDELSNAFLYAWDVTDPTDIVELDKIRSSLSEGRATPHNVHVLNDFLVTSYYKDGLNIVDANRPANLVEVGYFDTNELDNGGTDGNWGAYPFLPSGLVLATDIEEGLFVFQVDYKRACYLEGKVTDATTTLALTNVLVLSAKDELETDTDNTGEYKSGTVDAGAYDVTYLKYGYLPETRNVSLTNGSITVEDVALSVAPQVNVTYQVVDALSNLPIPDAFIRTVAPADAATFDYTTDASGEATDPSLFAGQYSVIAGKWGYVTNEVSVNIDAANNQIQIALYPGYYDDFTFDYNWNVTGDAPRGIWERGEPNGTDLFGNTANPDLDLDTDYGVQAYVTGNMPGEYFEDDVDDGSTILISPNMDLSTYDDPVLRYHWWLLNFSTNGFRDGDDTLRVIVSSGGQSVEVAKYGNAWRNRWNKQEPIHLKNYFTSLGSVVTVRFEVGDLNDQNILEAGIDGFMITDGLNNVSIEEEVLLQTHIVTFPNPVRETLNIAYEVPVQAAGSVLEFELLTLSGQRLQTRKLSAFEGKISMDFPYAAGIYLGLLKLNGKTLGVKKIVK